VEHHTHEFVGDVRLGATRCLAELFSGIEHLGSLDELFVLSRSAHSEQPTDFNFQDRGKRLDLEIKHRSTAILDFCDGDPIKRDFQPC
jgi:hypothetical protein